MFLDIMGPLGISYIFVLIIKRIRPGFLSRGFYLGSMVGSIFLIAYQIL